MFSSGTCFTADQFPCQTLSHQMNKTILVMLYFITFDYMALRSHLFRSQLTPAGHETTSAWDSYLGPAHCQSHLHAATQTLQDTWTLTEA